MAQKQKEKCMQLGHKWRDKHNPRIKIFGIKNNNLPSKYDLTSTEFPQLGIVYIYKLYIYIIIRHTLPMFFAPKSRADNGDSRVCN